jgi:hypothetical protein
MEEKVIVTDKEHTYLVLKWGVNYLYDLYYLWAGGALGLSMLEKRAARRGEQLRNEADLMLADEIKKEIDRELIDSIANLATDQNKNE